jgi:tetratricopeptide (TPR) repeat protein
MGLEKFENIARRYPDHPLVVKMSLVAGDLAALHNADPDTAIEYYQRVVIKSRDPLLVFEAKKRQADVFLNRKQDYKKAIEIYGQLTLRARSSEEEVEFRSALAKANFASGQSFQSRVEIDELLKKKLEAQKRFDLSVLKANVLTSMGKSADAIAIYEQLMRDSPEEAQKAKLYLSLSTALEELGQIDRAIVALEKIDPKDANSEVVQLRIQKLIDRRRNMPGAQGLRR